MQPAPQVQQRQQSPSAPRDPAQPDIPRTRLNNPITVSATDWLGDGLTHAQRFAVEVARIRALEAGAG